MNGEVAQPPAASLVQPAAGLTHTGQVYAAAESLFRADPRWLGSDAALSIPLSPGRTLWLFGDTFLSQTGKPDRSLNEMARNTVAIQTGDDPRTASITFHAGPYADGKPGDFFPARGPRWYWPGHGLRLAEGPLVIFLCGFLPDAKAPLGFAHEGYSVAVIDNPDDAPTAWRVEIHDAAPSDFDAVPATAVVRQGEHAICLAIRQQGVHAGALVRHRAAALARGDVSHGEWWMGAERGWVAEAEVGAAGPRFVMDDAGAECSIHWDDRAQAFLHVASYGFGASTIGLRRAPALTGPWSEPVTVYRPPESDAPHAFVYAAKAHPEIRGPDASDLVITYATNHTDFNQVVTPHGFAHLYWPRAVSLRIDR